MNSFLTIPFRVVVNDILSIHELEPEKEFDLFGYFKKDPTRKIFQMFLSIKPKTHKICMDSQRVIHLSVTPNGDETLVEELFKNSSKWTSLQSLFIYREEFSGSNDNWFADPNAFPKLKRFNLRLCEVTSPIRDLTKWTAASNVWKNIEHFAFRCFSENYDPTDHWYFPLFDTPGYGKNLKHLRFENLQFFNKDSLNRIIDVPNLQSLDLQVEEARAYSYFPLEHVTSAENLRRFLFPVRDNTFNKVKDFILRCPNLETVYLPDATEGGTHDLNFLFQKKIKELMLWEPKGMYWDKWTNEKNATFLKSVEIIDIDKVDGVEKNFKGVDFPALKELRLGYFKFQEPFDPSSLPSLEKVIFCNTEGLTDHFFQHQSFPFLKYLEVVHRDYNIYGLMPSELTGEKWNPMPNLEHLIFENMEKLTDWIFQNLEMPKLCDLDIRRSPSLSGEGWKKCNTQNIKRRFVLDLRSEEEEEKKKEKREFFSPELFVEEDRFLETIMYFQIKGIFLEKKYWAQWKVMCEHLGLVSCNCDDSMFQEGEGEWKKVVVDLKVKKIKEKGLEGKGWKRIENLKHLYVSNCEHFKKDELMKNRPFPEGCYVYGDEDDDFEDDDSDMEDEGDS